MTSLIHRIKKLFLQQWEHTEEIQSERESVAHQFSESHVLIKYSESIEDVSKMGPNQLIEETTEQQQVNHFKILGPNVTIKKNLHILIFFLAKKRILGKYVKNLYICRHMYFYK